MLFKVNFKVFVEKEGEGMVKLIYNLKMNEILGMWIMGLYVADLIYEAFNVIFIGVILDDLKFIVYVYLMFFEVIEFFL